MKKAELERRIARLAKDHLVEWKLLGGSKHDKFSFNGTIIMIPRHREIGESLARKIIRDCEQTLEERPWSTTS